MRFEQILKCRCCRRSSDVQRQTVPRSRTSDVECPVADLAANGHPPPGGGMWRSSRAAEWRAERLATVVTGTHSSFIYDGAGPFIAL